MSELDRLKVYGDTSVGWCRLTPPNETVDEHGNPSLHSNGFNAADPRAPRNRVYDDPEVCKLREYLRHHNGIRGLEILEPHEIDRAARIFFRDGFVVVRDLLDPDALDGFREGCARALKEILEVPGIGGRKYMTESFRLPHRYSYGTSSASRHMLHEQVWASMIDLPTTTPILSKIFAGRNYWVVGAGGDLCLPGAIEYQALHVDVRERESYQVPIARLRQARRLGIELRKQKGSQEIDRSSWQLAIERTPPMVTINFLMTDLTWENGPIRQIPGTQGRVANPPSPEEEPEWMRLSTLVGAPAGAGVFRDSRAWHGATPNVGREIRAMPNVEYGAPWMDERWFAPSMPHEIWKSLSPHAQRISRRIKTPPSGPRAPASCIHCRVVERKRRPELKQNRVHGRVPVFAPVHELIACPTDCHLCCGAQNAVVLRFERMRCEGSAQEIQATFVNFAARQMCGAADNRAAPWSLTLTLSRQRARESDEELKKKKSIASSFENTRGRLRAFYFARDDKIGRSDSKPEPASLARSCPEARSQFRCASVARAVEG